MKKCEFLKKTVTFLGHVLCNGQIQPSTEKKEAIKKFPEPKSVKQLQSFLGLAGYFRKFVPDFAKLARPLTELTKKDVPYKFSLVEREAFEILKNCLCCEPVLRIFHPQLETQLHTDASKDGFGACLMQKDLEDDRFHPVFYLSFKTTASAEKLSSYELEVLAIVRALNKLRAYLLGIKFTTITDCKAFDSR